MLFSLYPSLALTNLNTHISFLFGIIFILLSMHEVFCLQYHPLQKLLRAGGGVTVVARPLKYVGNLIEIFCLENIQFLRIL